MKVAVFFVIIFGITIPSMAQNLKPGTPEWERHFAEHKKKMEAFRKSNKNAPNNNSSFKTSTSSKLKSRLNDPEFQAQRKKEIEERRAEARKQEIASFPATYRRSYADALDPKPFERDKAPSVTVTLNHLSKIVDEAKSFEEIVPYLSSIWRLHHIRRIAGVNNNTGLKLKSSEEELKHYKEFFSSFDKLDSTSGSDNKNYAYAYVWTNYKGRVLYRLEFVGEGRLWRLNSWRGELSVQ